MLTAGVDFTVHEREGMTWIADHWTVNDQDAMDAIGPELFWQWVERGLAGG